LVLAEQEKKGIVWILCRGLSLVSFGWLVFELFAALPACRALLLALFWALLLLASLALRVDRLLPSHLIERVPVWLGLCAWLLIVVLGIGTVVTDATHVEAMLFPLKSAGLLPH
jgi:hypothetical protein